jgi:steroid delta-isomerase-like uncharacterized protein
MMMKLLLTLICPLLFLLNSCKGKQEDQNRKIAIKEQALEQSMITASEKYLKAWNENDMDLIRTITMNDFVRKANGEITSPDQRGIEGVMQYWHTAIPDLKITLDQLVVKDGKSYTSWTCTGTNTGNFGETPPTGKKIKTTGFTVLTFNEDGKIMKEDAYYDLLGMVEGWGYTLTPPIME